MFVLYARPWDDVGRVTSTWETYYQEHFGEEGRESFRLEKIQSYESVGYQLLFYQITVP